VVKESVVNLATQLILPGGASSQKFSEIVRKPAAVVLAEGDAPPTMGVVEVATINSVRPLEKIEAQSLIQQEDNRKTLPKVPLDAAGVMRTRHHAIARLLAAGRTKAEVGRIVGCAPATLSLLERSPAFQALLLEYMNMLDKSAIETQTKLKIMNSLGVDELTHRLLTNTENLKTTEILDIVKIASDRTGLGPTSKNVTLNGRISPADIRALKDATYVEAVLEADSAEWSEVGEAGESADVPEYGESEGESAPKARNGFREKSGEGLTTTDDLSDILSSLDTL
jgi:hypothetical protein